jgi:hypothetical protein
VDIVAVRDVAKRLEDLFEALRFFDDRRLGDAGIEADRFVGACAHRFKSFLPDHPPLGAPSCDSYCLTPPIRL